MTQEEYLHLQQTGRICNVCGAWFPASHGYSVACIECWEALGGFLQSENGVGVDDGTGIELMPAYMDTLDNQDEYGTPTED